ncbi:MAG: tetratricopeptide repeat protein [Verrucomicrobia bacterium]|nr:tetratricopeptide repeat protein [Verrucomicrobiota bacterium]
MPVERTPGRLRVVMLGESAAGGFPLDEYNLGRMTRVLWDERFPGEPMEMATVAMVGINSHILRVFAREAMQLKPDVVVLYIGHNEVIGPYGPVSKFAGALPSENLAQLSLWVRNTRTGRAIESGLENAARLTRSAGQNSSWIGLDEFGNSRIPADDPSLDRMLGQTRGNLRAIIRTALDHGSKVLVCVPAVNLTDWPPPASAAGTEEISARAAYAKARELEAAGRREEAWKYYRRACDLDLLRLRADSRVRQLQRDLVAEFNTPDVAMVDADFWMHEWNPVFRSDADYFLEHVHLTFEGRVAVTSLIVDGIAELTGRSPQLGVGRGDYSGIDDWWRSLPQRNEHARTALLFTEYDEGRMWGSIEKLLGMHVFDGLSDRDERRAAAKKRSEVLQATAHEQLDQERIRSAYAEALKWNSDEWVDHSAAQLWSFAENGREFWQALEAAHGKYPFFRLAHYQMASRATRQKSYEEALEHVRALEGMRDSEDIVPMLYGEIYWASGKPAQAIPFLERHASHLPKDYVRWFNLGMACQLAGRPADAAKAYRRALDADPENVMVRGALAKLLIDQDRPTRPDLLEALKLSREMLVQQPDNLDARLVLAVALLANGQTAEAQSTFDALVARATELKNPSAISKAQKSFQEARAKFQQ